MNFRNRSNQRHNERGAALATSLIILTLLGAISMTVLAVVTHESRIAGSDLQRTQTFYAAAAGIEKMTSDFSNAFARSANPDLSGIPNGYPTELTGEGFSFVQTLQLDPNAPAGTVIIPNGSFSGMFASVKPYVLQSRATQNSTSTSVMLERRMNNYLIPIFQFGMFSNDDLEVHPGPAFAFNGRVHANGNLYISGTMTFLSKVTTANELITDVLRNGNTHAEAMSVQVGAVNVPLTAGSMVNGPNISGAQSGQRGYWPGSPSGTVNASWNSTSTAAATGAANRFGGQVLTGTTGATKLLLPMQLEGNLTREITKRMMPNDYLSPTLSNSRFHSKASVRILIDTEGVANDASGIPAGQGVNLSTFDPIPLPNSDAASGGGRALWRINDSGVYTDTAASCLLQQNQGSSTAQALTVRGTKSATQTNVTPAGSAVMVKKIPSGASLSGHLLIQIVDANGTTYDVTRQILSMGMTEGEPNAIVSLQRPLWMAFTQGSRDASGSSNPILNGDPAYTNSLMDIINNTRLAYDGEIKHTSGSYPVIDPTYGYLTAVVDDTAAGQRTRSDTPPSNSLTTLGTDWGAGTTPGANWYTNKDWNAIVPINVYNVREGYINGALSSNTIYERGITNVIEINMRNLARWLDGVYDTNLLAGTSAVSTNIAKPDGYSVYVSDRRGDRVKSLVDPSGATLNSTNGMVDNEDIYGSNNTLDPGEDVQETGALVKDTTELPDPATQCGSTPAFSSIRNLRAVQVAAWTNPCNYFRRSVRLFNGENLQISGAAGKLSPTLGITVATENMIYIWGNYNTTGINVAPPDGTAALNDSTATYHYNGNQVPSSIVCDAFFPLSKTFFDAETAINPDQLSLRPADNALPPGATSETSARTGIIAGNTLSAIAGSPDAGNSASGESRLCGGMHNFPRFLENWSARWNYVGSLIPLYHSTQALGPYNADSTLYGAPIRDWAFDITFTDPTKLPPGTPLFQHIEPTGFKQIL